MTQDECRAVTGAIVKQMATWATERIEAAIAPLRARIEVLEAQLAAREVPAAAKAKAILLAPPRQGERVN
jgi:uncharacterized small protein (DUF1192 family)